MIPTAPLTKEQEAEMGQMNASQVFDQIEGKPATPPAATAPVEPVPPSAGSSPSQAPADVPPAAELPASGPVEGMPPFTSVEGIYKSWKHSNQELSRRGNQLTQYEQRLKAQEEELQRLKAQASAVPPAAHPMSKEDMVNLFVNDPSAYNALIENQVRAKYVDPMAQALLAVGRELQSLREEEAIPASERAVFQQMKAEGILEQQRDRLPATDRNVSARILYEMAKAQMLQETLLRTQQQLQSQEAERQKRNARVVTAQGGTPPAAATNLMQMDLKELEALARAEAQTLDS